MTLQVSILHFYTGLILKNYFEINKLLIKVENNKVRKLIITVPNKDPKQAKYNYTQSTYIRKFRQVLSASTGGKYYNEMYK